MKNISEISYQTIRKLIIESEWGKAVTNKELFNFLFDEVYEFVDGCNKNNKDNILEEASDVLMILLYIVIKNVDNQEENQINELLRRLNKKLQTRYSTFFEGTNDDGDEELNWEKTKYIEKEVLSYIYCPNINCTKYAKINRGNMTIDNNQVKCCCCGYTARCSNDNMILYRSKYRRKTLNILEKSYDGYLKGTPFYADDYFNSYRQDYLKVIRYWIVSQTRRLALSDCFISKHNATVESFEEFLMYPLRNCLQNILGDKSKLSYSLLEVNDMMLRCINADYIAIKNSFCKDISSYEVWISYIFYLIKTITVPVEYDSYNQATLTPFDFLTSTIRVCVVLEKNKKIDVLLKPYSASNGVSGTIIEADISACKKNSQIGQVIFSVVMQHNLQRVQNLNCVLLNLRDDVDKKEVSELLNDLLPKINNIDYQ
ncbi:MAG: hypothetical protein K2I96_02355 [Lachnospiraceae bacterium]|nr:hypothetical protein [Lachnospiraceae bacterium]